MPQFRVDLEPVCLEVHIEDTVLGMGETAEQVISLSGELQRVQIALPMILEKDRDLDSL